MSIHYPERVIVFTDFLCLYFLINKQKILHVWTMFVKIYGKSMHNTSASDGYHGQ